MTVFVDLVGFGIVIPVLPLYAERFGASDILIGLLLASYAVMQFISSPILGRLSDRIGRRPVLLVSLLGTSLGFLITGLAGTLWVLFVGRIVAGITGGSVSTAQAYIADVTPPDHRSEGMGLIGAAFGLGLIVGPAIGGVMSHVSAEAPFLFAAGLGIANVAAMYFFLPESLSEQSRQRADADVSLATVMREPGGWRLLTILATYFLTVVAFSILTTTYALFTHRRFGLDATHNGYLFAYAGLLGAGIQLGLLGRLGKVFGDQRLAVAGAAIFALGMVLLPTGATIAMLLVATSAISVGTSLVTPTLNGLASESARADRQGSMQGVMASVSSLARIMGPLAGGFLLAFDARGAHDGRALFWTGAGVMVVALALAATISSPRASGPPATRTT